MFKFLFLFMGAPQGQGANPLAEWLPTILLFVIVYLLVFHSRRKEAEAKKRQEEAQRQAYEEARRKDEQRRYQNELIALGEQSIGLFESMPRFLSTAESYLDQAEVDFADGAFAPFWDSIEKAVKMLGRFNENIHHIKENSSHYTELIKKYEDTPPQFPLAHQSITKLGVGTATAERMKAIVRTAQRNFQFATIYEQRKTNQILIAGFTNLAQALDQMNWHITASINDLTGSVGVMTSTLNESMQAIHSRMGDIAETTTQHHEELIKATSERAEREKKALDMLDNIQRGRRPSP